MTGHQRARYLSDSVATASPGRLLVMLHDRLISDLAQAEATLRGADGAPDGAGPQRLAPQAREVVAHRLLHAQDILAELRSSLDVTAWSGGPGLAALYGFLFTELVTANIQADADRVAACRALVEPLRDAWRQALVASGGGDSGGTDAAPGGAPAAAPVQLV